MHARTHRATARQEGQRWCSACPGSTKNAYHSASVISKHQRCYDAASAGQQSWWEHHQAALAAPQGWQLPVAALCLRSAPAEQQLLSKRVPCLWPACNTAECNAAVSPAIHATEWPCRCACYDASWQPGVRSCRSTGAVNILHAPSCPGPGATAVDWKDHRLRYCRRWQVCAWPACCALPGATSACAAAPAPHRHHRRHPSAPQGCRP